VHICDAAGLRQHVEHVHAEVVLAHAHQLLSQVFDQVFKLEVVGVVLDGDQQLRDTVALQQRHCFLIGGHLPHHFVHDDCLEAACLGQEVQVLDH